MRSVRRVMAVAGVVVASVMLVAETAHAADVTDEAAFVEKLNELRSSGGLGSLTVNGPLTTVARAWAGEMAAAGAISHNPSLAQQAPSTWQRLGENVGVGPTVQALHDAFVASPTHYRNMVDGRFREVGVGVVYGTDGRIYVTVAFMTAVAAPPAVAAPTAAAPAAARTARVAAGEVTVCRKTRSGRTVCRGATTSSTATAGR